MNNTNINNIINIKKININFSKNDSNTKDNLPILNLLNNNKNEIISLNHNFKCNVYPCYYTTYSYDIIRSIQDYYEQKNNIIKCPSCNRIIIKYSLI